MRISCFRVVYCYHTPTDGMVKTSVRLASQRRDAAPGNQIVTQLRHHFCKVKGFCNSETIPLTVYVQSLDKTMEERNHTLYVIVCFKMYIKYSSFNVIGV